MNQGLANSYESANESARNIQQSFVTASIAGQRIGILIAEVQDVLNKQKIHKIPLSPPAVVGALNLRGRIVTALDLRLCLNLAPCAAPESAMSIVVEYENELYSLLVDEIGDVETPPSHLYERPPATLGPAWRTVCSGVYRMDEALLLTLDIANLLEVTVDGAVSQ
jgi:purine-binding chemotaxis protein CheW